MSNGAEKLLSLANSAFKQPFGAVLCIAVNGGRPLWVDGRSDPPTISFETPKGAGADCTWHGAQETMERVLAGERALESAFVSGRLRIAGDMSVMARLSLENTR